jgi:hypothetical protein
MTVTRTLALVQLIASPALPLFRTYAASGGLALGLEAHRPLAWLPPSGQDLGRATQMGDDQIPFLLAGTVVTWDFAARIL